LTLVPSDYGEEDVVLAITVGFFSRVRGKKQYQRPRK
jgi:hypothetical protein